ncbi:MAG: 30S ribosomal protein S6 [Chthoniobacterales bacterium]
MTKRYEALIAINIQGKEDNYKDVTERLEKDIKAAGATLEQTQRLEKRDFAYEHNHLKSAYYVNFILQAEPTQIETLRAKFTLDSEVALQQYTRLPNAAAA